MSDPLHLPPADVAALVREYGAACEAVGEAAGLNRMAELTHANNAERALLAALARPDPAAALKDLGNGIAWMIGAVQAVRERDAARDALARRLAAELNGVHQHVGMSEARRNRIWAMLSAARAAGWLPPE